MKLLPKIVTLSLTLAMLGIAGTAQAQNLAANNETTTNTETNNLLASTNIDPVETAFHEVIIAKIADKPSSFPADSTVKEFGNGSLIVIPNEEINRDKRFSLGGGRGRFRLYLSEYEQGLIAAGAAGGIAAAICATGGPGWCIAGGTAMGIAAYHLARNPVCHGRLVVSAGLGAGAKCE